MKCSECDEPKKARGLCVKHYRLWWTAQDRGPCTQKGCSRNVLTGGLCDMHYSRVRRHGSPDVVLCGDFQPGEQHPRWLGDAIGYYGAHDRVKTLRGSASLYCCVDCGQPASDWSYNGFDPNELFDRCRYSPDPIYYEARCKTHHGVYDSEMRRAKAGLKFESSTPTEVSGLSILCGSRP